MSHYTCPFSQNCIQFGQKNVPKIKNKRYIWQFCSKKALIKKIKARKNKGFRYFGAIDLNYMIVKSQISDL